MRWIFIFSFDLTCFDNKPYHKITSHSSLLLATHTQTSHISSTITAYKCSHILQLIYRAFTLHSLTYSPGLHSTQLWRQIVSHICDMWPFQWIICKRQGRDLYSMHICLKKRRKYIRGSDKIILNALQLSIKIFGWCTNWCAKIGKSKPQRSVELSLLAHRNRLKCTHRRHLKLLKFLKE